MSHLATLANQITFKKSFSDKIVLEAFVRDITGEHFIAGKIETEKEFTPSAGRVKVKYDIFAESEDGRVILELQRVRYDNHFDRFMYYFLNGIVEQVGGHDSYGTSRRVITIVLLTAPYKHKDLSGRLVEDPLLITDLDPRTLDGRQRLIFGHKLFYLNPRYSFTHLPPPTQEWMHLVNQSMKEPEMNDHQPLGEQLGIRNPAVIRAAQLSLWDGFSMEERTEFVKAGAAEQAMVSIQEALEEERKLKEDALAREEEERRLKEVAMKEVERLRALLSSQVPPREKE